MWKWRGIVAGGLSRVHKGVKHVLTRDDNSDPVHLMITVGGVGAQGSQDGLIWGGTSGQPSQARGQLRVSTYGSHIKRRPQWSPRSPLIIPWCKWPYFQAPQPTLYKQPRVAT